ncbi:cell envelope integrity protein TolA [Ruminobacter sp. RM87]|uniref:cell envelope integrity protein TolA n=1 Tax=Ruminobacter sp. RM87 TaxID=1200567 RepID=UPI00068D87BB|nr:cell envelope integrity protein TolA [Ruminobacter sp. RM87]
MINQFTRVLVGSVILLILLAWSVPKFFPHDNASDHRQPREIVDQPVKKDSQDQNNGGNAEDAVDEDDSMDEDFGYGSLLEDEGSSAPAEYADASIKSGVVVGADVKQNGRFVPNPTVTGNTPADVARKQAEQARKTQNAEQQNPSVTEAELQAAEKRRIEAEKQAEIARLNAERKAQEDAAKAQAEADRRAKAEAARLQAEADRRAKAEAARLQAEADRRARAEAEARARAEAQAKARAEAEKRAAEAAPAGKIDSTPSGRYLQIGTFSTLAKANEVRNRLKAAKIGVPKEYINDLGSGFGYKVVPNNGNFTVLVGPAKRDGILRAVKPRVDSVASVNSILVSR